MSELPSITPLTTTPPNRSMLDDTFVPLADSFAAWMPVAANDIAAAIDWMQLTFEATDQAKTQAADSATLSKNWATTTGELVAATDYSSREWAIGAVAESAKRWATELTEISGGLKGARGYAQDAQEQAEIVASGANFQGAWSGLSGPLVVPASVFHNGEYWQLLNDVADITLSEPGVSADWASTSPPASGLFRVARTSNIELTVDDSGKLFDIESGTFAQTFSSSATLGDGWFCKIRNAGTGTITLTPSGSEAIGGAATCELLAGEMATIVSDGSNLYIFWAVITRVVKITSSAPFVPRPGIFRGRLRGVGAGGGGGRSSSANISNGGGGGGFVDAIVPLIPNNGYSVVVGAAGLAGATDGANGSDGGNTTAFSLFANGGKGAVSNSSIPTQGGDASNSSNGFGSPGLKGESLGGSSPYGSGGGFLTLANGYGSGGGGAPQGLAAGDGRPGLVIIEEML